MGHDSLPIRAVKRVCGSQKEDSLTFYGMRPSYLDLLPETQQPANYFIIKRSLFL